MKRINFLFSLLIAGLVFTGSVYAQGKSDMAGAPLFTTLTGAAEVPGPGDPDGSGSAVIKLNHGRGLVCWTIMVADIELPATAAHIHIGDENTAGPIVVTLAAPDEDGFTSGCTEADRDLIRSILIQPELFYVNVHNAEFPPGAVRGQLRRAGQKQ
jgi:hypothetical protein